MAQFTLAKPENDMKLTVEPNMILKWAVKSTISCTLYNVCVRGVCSGSSSNQFHCNEKTYVYLWSFQFSDIDMRASEQGINPYSGQYKDIGRSMAWLPQTLALYVIPHTQIPLCWRVSHCWRLCSCLINACLAPFSLTNLFLGWGSFWAA